MDSGVNPLHERARFKFCVSVWGVVSCKGACQFTRPQSESIFVFVTQGCRQLLGNCHFARPQSESIFVFVTQGCRQLLGSRRFARPQSESVSVFDCLRLRLSPSSPVSFFVCFRLRPSPSSSISVSVCPRQLSQVVGPEGVGCLSDVLHRGSGNHRVVRVLSLCGIP